MAAHFGFVLPKMARYYVRLYGPKWPTLRDRPWNSRPRGTARIYLALGVGGDIGYVSILARVVGRPQSFRNRLGLSHHERSNGRAVLLHDFRFFDFAGAVAQV